MSFKKNKKTQNGFLLLAIGLIVSSLLSCNQKQSGDIEISLKTTKVNLFQSDKVSCKALYDQDFSDTPATPDVQAISFEAPTITISTPSTKNIQLEWIKIELLGTGLSGGKAECLVSGEKLVASFKYDTATNIPYYDSGAISFPLPNFATTKVYGTSTFCPIRCGGVAMLDKNKNSSGSGRVIVYGINTTDSEPNLSETFFEWEYLGAP